MRPVRCLMPQQVAVSPRIEHGLIGLRRIFPDRKRDRAVRKLRFDRQHQRADGINIAFACLPALQNKGAEAERIPLPAAGQDLLCCEPVARAVTVGAPDAAVQAVVPANVADLDQAADIDGIPVYAVTGTTRLFRSIRSIFVCPAAEQGGVFVERQCVLAFQPVEQLLGTLTHRLSHWSRLS